jgi:hypothetical protein
VHIVVRTLLLSDKAAAAPVADAARAGALEVLVGEGLAFDWVS